MTKPIFFSAKESGIVQRGRPFVKMHGLRNDFVIVDGRREPYRPHVSPVAGQGRTPDSRN